MAPAYPLHPASETLRRLLRDEWFTAMADPEVTDLDVSATGLIQFKRNGRYEPAYEIDGDDVREAVQLISAAEDDIIDENRPSLATVFPGTNLRTLLQHPPVVEPGPTIHVRTQGNFEPTLDTLVDLDVMTPAQARFLREALLTKKNVLIAGLPGSAKTTVQRALIRVLESAPWRVLLFDELHEIATTATNIKTIHPQKTGFNAKEALDAALLDDPAAICYGEVRTAEQGVSLIRAWLAIGNGGTCTAHSDDARGVLVRFADFYRELGLHPIVSDIARVVNVIVHMQCDRRGPIARYRASEVVTVTASHDATTLSDLTLTPIA